MLPERIDMPAERVDMPAERIDMPAERVDMGGYTLIEHASLANRNTLRVNARAALLAEAVKKKTPVCYEDLGPEAICRLEVENFYAIVGIDSRGNTIIR